MPEATIMGIAPTEVQCSDSEIREMGFLVVGIYLQTYLVNFRVRSGRKNKAHTRQGERHHSLP
jgi:hypothetical protein